MRKRALAWSAILLIVIASVAAAHPASYAIDPDHTYPSFAADHMGLSSWRGKFNHSSGTITLDREKYTGTVHIITKIDGINFGNPALTQMVLRDAIPAPLCKAQCAFFDAAQYPTRIRDGKLADFVDGVPTRVVGKLTLHGITRAVDLKIEHFK